MKVRFGASISGGAIFFAIIFGIPTAGAQTVTNLTSCQRITVSGSYRLANNITGSGWCFSIRAANVTFDGNGKTITTPTGEALEVADYSNDEIGFSNVTITHLTSGGGVRTFGNNINHVTFQNLNVDGITVHGSDDVTIKNNVVGQGGIQVNNADRPWVPYRPIVTGNTVTGGSTDAKILVELAGGATHPCPRVDGVFTNNTITDTRNDPPPDATAAVRIRCATHTTFTNNIVHSTGTTMGLYMRDESDDGTYEGNVFWTHDHETIRIASGNVDKTFPSRNTFTNNVFRSDLVATMYLQGIGGGNVFRNNVFWGSPAEVSQVSGAFGNTWDHNTFYVTGNGPVTRLTYRDGPPADSWTNNIFSYASGSLFGYDGWASSRYAGDYNLFYNRSGAVSFGTPGPTLPVWRSATGSDGHSIEANPKFINPATGDFRLASTSPARGKASDGGTIGYTAGSTPKPILNTKPTVVITNLPALQRVTGKRTVNVSAKDSDGIGSVSFSVDGKQVTVDRTAPYSVIVDTRLLRNGTHTLSVIAVDRLSGATTVRRQFISTNPLSIQTTVPIAGVRSTGTIVLQPGVIYGGSSIRRARYVVDGQALKTIYQAPWSTTLSTKNFVNGWHSITISLRDSAGALASKNIRVYIKN